MTEDDHTKLLQELVKLQGQSVRLQALTLRQTIDNKAEFIATLSRAGLENPLIAQLLADGTTTDAIRMTISRDKKARSG